MKFKILSCLLAINTMCSVQPFTVINQTSYYAYLYEFSCDAIIVAPNSQYKCDVENFSKTKNLKVWVNGAYVFEKNYDDLGVDEYFDTTKVLGICPNSRGDIEAKIYTISHPQK